MPRDHPSEYKAESEELLLGDKSEIAERLGVVSFVCRLRLSRSPTRLPFPPEPLARRMFYLC